MALKKRNKSQKNNSEQIKVEELPPLFLAKDKTYIKMEQEAFKRIVTPSESALTTSVYQAPKLPLSSSIISQMHVEGQTLLDRINTLLDAQQHSPIIDAV